MVLALGRWLSIHLLFPDQPTVIHLCRIFSHVSRLLPRQHLVRR
jgi:hypothetical protein